MKKFFGVDLKVLRPPVLRKCCTSFPGSDGPFCGLIPSYPTKKASKHETEKHKKIYLFWYETV